MDDVKKVTGKDDEPAKEARDFLQDESIKTRKEATEILLKNFDTLDADKNGFLSGAELLKEENKRNYNTKDFEAAYLARNYMANIRDYNSDEGWFEQYKGISKEDLAKFEKAKKTDKFAQEFDRALKAFQSVTRENIVDSKHVAKELAKGNSLPLALGFDQQKDYWARKKFFEGVNSEYSAMRKQDKSMPAITMELTYGRYTGAPAKLSDGEYRFTVKREPTWSNWNTETFFFEQYCPHAKIRYAPYFNVLEQQK